MAYYVKLLDEKVLGLRDSNPVVLFVLYFAVVVGVSSVLFVVAERPLRKNIIHYFRARQSARPLPPGVVPTERIGA